MGDGGGGHIIWMADGMAVGCAVDGGGAGIGVDFVGGAGLDD